MYTALIDCDGLMVTLVLPARPAPGLILPESARVVASATSAVDLTDEEVDAWAYERGSVCERAV